MKNLASQIVIARANPEKKNGPFNNFANMALGRTYVAASFSVKITSAEINYETGMVKFNNLEDAFDIPSNKINWFKGGAWIKDYGAII